MSAFTVVRKREIPVRTIRTVYEVVVETDDWVEAERTCSDALKRSELLSIQGVHPTHTFPHEPPSRDDRCVDCGAINNGSYGSHAPCGYDFGGKSLLSALDDEEAMRKIAKA